MLTRQLIDLIQDSEPLNNQRVVRLAIEGITDYVASSLFAKQQYSVQQLMRWLLLEGGNASTCLIGHQSLVTPRQAALFNGYQAHLLDYDDVHAQVRGHPSAVILSALLSQISFTQQMSTYLTGQRFLAAYVIGIEVMARLGVAVGAGHYIKGWHNTATLGGIAATAAICYFLDKPFIAEAMAIAATQSAGLRLHFGSDIKPLHAGLAAQQAVLAVSLCQYGLLVNGDFLDENIGFLALYGQGNAALDLADWGEPWRIERPGLWFKNYPYCSANAYVVDAMRLILHQHCIDIWQINIIRVTFPAQGDAALIYRLPERQDQGRFSAEYVIACLLQHQKLDENNFQPIPIDDFTSYLMTKVVRQYRDIADIHFVQVEIILNNQYTFSAKVENPRGSPENPYHRQEIMAKLTQAIGNQDKVEQFEECLAYFNSHLPVQQVIKLLQKAIQ